MLTWALIACNEYGVKPAAVETTAPPPVESDGAPPALELPFEEACFAVAVAAPGVVPLDPACDGSFAPAADPWATDVEWVWDTLADGGMASVWITPVVADMTGDGRPEVAFTACLWQNGAFGTCLAGPRDPGNIVSYEGSLVILDGQTGSVVLERRGYDVMAPLAVADLDGDGVSEVLATTIDGYLESVDGLGRSVFRTASIVNYPNGGLWSCTNVADLDADGAPEVISDNATWHLDGSFDLVVFGPAVESELRTCVVGDLDQDGDQEWVVGRQVVDRDGVVEAELAVPDVALYETSWTVPVQADDDVAAEIVYIGSGAFSLLDTDGSLLVHVPLPNTDRSGPPCLGDFDGDGVSELAAPLSDLMYLFELDGSVRWSVGIDDGTGVSGCSGFDFDADGALEVVYADHDRLYVFDGATGAARINDPGRASGTVTDTPVVADVDGDGSAELILTGNDDQSREGWRGVVALGHVDDQWPPAGPVWSGNDYAVTNLRADGSVPRVPGAAWLDPGVYRARPALDLRPELSVAAIDACVPSCDPDAAAMFSVQVVNDGSLDVSEVTLTFVSDRDGEEVALDAVALGPITAGEALAGVVFSVPVAELGDGVRAYVTVDDTCDASDDGVAWASPCR
jgi:hypothetical protein